MITIPDMGAASAALITLATETSELTFAAGDASTSAEGLTKLDVAPTSPTAPIAVGINSPAITQTPATMTSLRALTGAGYDKAVAFVVADGSLWRFAATSTLTDEGFLVAGSGTGRWLRLDKEVDITAAITSSTADAAVLYTVPAGFTLRIGVPFWKVGTTMTTASAGAAGLSSSNAGLATKGDLLGGSSGDLVATLVSTGAYAKGTVGTMIGQPGAVITAGETIRFDLIAGTFTGGAMTAHIPVQVLIAPAA